MKFALINPNWNFEGSVFFGCGEPHLPIEYAYAKALLERSGHEATIIDAQFENFSLLDVQALVLDAEPDYIVVTTAPNYLFWRCAPPELRIPKELLAALCDVPGTRVAVGPHASVTPGATLDKLGVDLVIMGEFEEVLAQLAAAPPGDWSGVEAVAYRIEGQLIQQGAVHASDMESLPALHWAPFIIGRHEHHHQRHDKVSFNPSAEMEVSRGCAHHCSFCAKDCFRGAYRRRPLAVVLEELDGLVAQGVDYVYFIDDNFQPWPELLEALTDRSVSFGIQTRIEPWDGPLLEQLGRAGCVSIEVGLESIRRAGRTKLDRDCALSTAQLVARLIEARRRIPHVQAWLVDNKTDAPAMVKALHTHLAAHQVRLGPPVPLFPYPGSPAYRKKWGAPDDKAWERAHAWYLKRYTDFSHLKNREPGPPSSLARLETDPSELYYEYS